MKNVILSLVFVWFLVIQSIGLDGRAIGVIPVQDEVYCNKVIQSIKYKGFVNVQYNCVNVGDIKLS